MKLNNKKICILPAWYPTKSDPVAGIFIQEQAEVLAEAGALVSVLFVEKSALKNESPCVYSIQNNVHTFTKRATSLPKLTTRLINRWAHLYQDLIRLHIEKIGVPDVFHSHSYIGGFIGRRLAQEYSRPLVHTEHSTNFITGKILPWHKNEIRELFNHVNSLIAVGHILKQSMQTFTQRKINVIPNMVNEEVFYPAEKKEDLPFTYIVVGGLEKRKQVHLIIESFSKIKESNSNLKIVGDGVEIKNLLKLVRQLNLESRVLFMGSLSLNNVAQQMRKSNALISLSQTETFGKVIIEAHACGLPVIALNNADPEILITQMNGLIIDSPKSLSSCMEIMINTYSKFNSQEISLDSKAKFGKASFLNKLSIPYNRSTQ